MKIKKNEVLFLAAFLGVLIAVAVYVWLFNPTREKTEALEAENAALASHVKELEEWEKQVDYFQEETQRMIVDVNDVFVHFPPESRAEDAIMYAVELEAQDTRTYISAIGLLDPEMIYSAAPTTIKLNNLQEDGERTYQLFRQQVTYTQEFSYNGMKRFVNEIVDNYNSRSIETINIAYDNTTGILVGTTTMNLFTLTGTDKEYQKTSIPSMATGTDNIFGTLEITGTDVTPVEAGEEETAE